MASDGYHLTLAKLRASVMAGLVPAIHVFFLRHHRAAHELAKQASGVTR
jgi:hypothetical protein